MLGKCCFCIGLRPATLILATLGALANLVNAYHFSVFEGNYGFLYTVLSTYYLGASLACICGFQGVLKNKVKYVKIFAIYYWWQLLVAFTLSIMISVIVFYFEFDVCEKFIGQPDVDMTLEECLDFYFKSAAFLVISLAVGCLIELHFCMAVWAYYKRLSVEQQYRDISDVVYHVQYTPVQHASIQYSAQYSAPEDSNLPPAYESVHGILGDQKFGATPTVAGKQ
ncbi:10150_t:CDS:2 [Paraglomus brasilianum]|uniref:10150_t:CDS:1 n=1 Tax=Paraglomus brasilianum TaxID=144538 RepID=A0A9N9EY73_9GLOM|nr:10150_t:CDS:2 [Paraglomus brasilianum]